MNKRAQKADAPPVDTSLVDYMLGLSPEERIELNDSAIELIEELQKAGKQLSEEKPKRTS